MAALLTLIVDEVVVSIVAVSLGSSAMDGRGGNGCPLTLILEEVDDSSDDEVTVVCDDEEEEEGPRKPFFQPLFALF